MVLRVRIYTLYIYLNLFIVCKLWHNKLNICLEAAGILKLPCMKPQSARLEFPDMVQLLDLQFLIYNQLIIRNSVLLCTNICPFESLFSDSEYSANI